MPFALTATARLAKYGLLDDDREPTDNDATVTDLAIDRHGGPVGLFPDPDADPVDDWSMFEYDETDHWHQHPDMAGYICSARRFHLDVEGLLLTDPPPACAHAVPWGRDTSRPCVLDAGHEGLHGLRYGNTILRFAGSESVR